MKKTSQKSKIGLIICILAVSVGVFGLIKSNRSLPTVALVDNDKSITTSMQSCVSNITSFSATGACGSNMVKHIDYSCANGQTGYEEKSECIDPQIAFAKAQIHCGQVCPTSTPSVIATAQPTSTVRPTATPPASQSPSHAPEKSPITKPLETPIPSGCYLQKIQCVKAPCDSVLICATSMPTPTVEVRPTITRQVTKTISQYACRLQCIFRARTYQSCVESCQNLNN